MTVLSLSLNCNVNVGAALSIVSPVMVVVLTKGPRLLEVPTTVPLMLKNS